MNHRLDGKVMFDVTSGTMLEGIGHYGYERSPDGGNEVVCHCSNAYPCDIDRGIIAGMARRFVESDNITHEPREPCRKKAAMAART